jgi:heat shock protein HtpX
MFIVNPLSGGNLMHLFSTHPPLEDRIAKLRGDRGETLPPVKREENSGRRQAEAMWDHLSGGKK